MRPVDRADSVTETNYVFCSDGKFQAGGLRKTNTIWRKNVVSFATIVALSTPITLVTR